MQFNLDGDDPEIRVLTFSSHYGVYSSMLDTYAQWYKAQEQPQMSDRAFQAADEFVVELDDFYTRFGLPDSTLLPDG